MNQKIKTAVNVGAVILVPLIKERHRLKQNQDYIRMRNRTMHTLSTTKDLAVMTKDKTVTTGHKITDNAANVKDHTVRTAAFVSQTTHDLQQKKKMKNEEKMNQHLAKEMEKRHAEEEKEAKKRQKEMVKAMKAAEKRDKKIPLESKQATQFVQHQVTQQRMKDEDRHNINDYIENRVMATNYTENVDNPPLFEQHRRQMAEKIRLRGKY